MINEKIKSAIRKRQEAMVSRGWLTTEPYTLDFVPKGYSPDTACWGFREGQHVIKMNDAVDDLVADLIKNNRQRKAFAFRVLEHENCHWMWTTREHIKLAVAARSARVPLTLWNLFEDARIEHIWRRRRKTKFHWVKYISLGSIPREAVNLLLQVKTLENNKKLIDAWLAESRDRDDPKEVAYNGDTSDVRPSREVILGFYREIIRAKSSEDLIPILQRWMKNFPQKVSDIRINIRSLRKILGLPDDGDNEDGVEEGIVIGPNSLPDIVEVINEAISEAIKEYEAEHGPITYEAEVEPTMEPPDRISIPVPVKPLMPRSEYFQSEPHFKMDYARGDRLVQHFARFLRHGHDKVHTSTVSARMDFRKLMRGSARVYRRHGEVDRGNKRLEMIYDTSGSMGGAHQLGGCYFLYVMNQLVRMGLVRCDNLILSGGLPVRVPMPFDDRIIEYIYPCGGIEGFAPTMRKFQSEMEAAELVIFFTDGNIVDEPIDKNYWRSRGVKTLGLYVGPPEIADSMTRWFDSVISRESIETLADSLIQMIRA